MQNIPFRRGAVSAGDCISDGWSLIRKNYGMFLGIGLVAMLISGCIPCVSLFLAGPILCGVYYVYLKELNGEATDFGMMFKGFDNFVTAMVAGIIWAIPEMLGQTVRLSANLTDFGLKLNGGSPDEIVNALGTGLLIGLGILGLCAFVLTIAFKICMSFTFQLISEHQLGVVDAIKLSAQAAWANLGGLLILFILEILIWIGGTLLCVVGLFLISMPLVYAANAYAYRQVFPKLRERYNENPPVPSDYGSGFSVGR